MACERPRVRHVPEGVQVSLFKKDYERAALMRAALIVRDVRKVSDAVAIVVEQAFVDFFAETAGKFNEERFRERCRKVKP